MNEALKKRWYVIQAFSGFEGRVAQSLREHIKIHSMENYFDEVLVPTEEQLPACFYSVQTYFLLTFQKFLSKSLIICFFCSNNNTRLLWSIYVHLRCSMSMASVLEE